MYDPFLCCSGNEAPPSEKLWKMLYSRIKAEGIVFVHGKETRKTLLQRLAEQMEEWLSKLKQYTNDAHICRNRNSYSKIYYDATFCACNEKHMKNGQLTPGIIVGAAACSEFIIGNYHTFAQIDGQRKGIQDHV